MCPKRQVGLADLNNDITPLWKVVRDDVIKLSREARQALPIAAIAAYCPVSAAPNVLPDQPCASRKEKLLGTGGRTAGVTFAWTYLLTFVRLSRWNAVILGPTLGSLSMSLDSITPGSA